MRVIERLMRQQVDVDEMQFGFRPGCKTTSADFFEVVTGGIFSKKEEFCTLHLQIWRKLLIKCLAILYGRVAG